MTRRKKRTAPSQFAMMHFGASRQGNFAVLSGENFHVVFILKNWNMQVFAFKRLTKYAAVGPTAAIYGSIEPFVTSVEKKKTFESAAKERAAGVYRALRKQSFETTDRMFAWLIVFEWLAAMAAASLVSPQIWPTENPWKLICNGGGIGRLDLPSAALPGPAQPGQGLDPAYHRPWPDADAGAFHSFDRRRF